jgi:hypothetical protein
MTARDNKQSDSSSKAAWHALLQLGNALVLFVLSKLAGLQDSDVKLSQGRGNGLTSSLNTNAHRHSETGLAGCTNVAVQQCSNTKQD